MPDTIVIERPGRPVFRIGPFCSSHEAEQWVHRLTDTPGRARPHGATVAIAPWNPGLTYDVSPDEFPLDEYDLAEIVLAQSPSDGGADSWPDTYDLLVCKVGSDQARQLWDAVCFTVDELQNPQSTDEQPHVPAGWPEGVPAEAVALYLTAAGQHLYVKPHSKGGRLIPATYRYHCTGCGRDSDPGPAAADTANRHAAYCRRVPLPGQQGWPGGNDALVWI